MKKQILIVLLVFIAGITTAFGQLIPREVTCLTGDALNPIPGNPYEYAITVPAPPSGSWGNLHYRWFVTQSTSFIENFNFAAVPEADGGPFMDVTGGSLYNIVHNDPGTLPQIEITWKSFAYDPTNPIFVGILVVGENGVCNPNNMKIYRIEPQHAFTLDIANVQGAVPLPGYGSNVDNCISNILSASYNVTESAIDYDFGIDTLYFAAAAANWSGQWELSVQLAGLQLGQTADIHWGYLYDETNPNIGFDYTVIAGAAADGSWTATDLVTVQGTGSSVGLAGEVIYIRLILKHGTQFEGIIDTQYQLAVNGILHDGAAPYPGFEDIDYSTCQAINFDDIAYQTLLARPEVQNNTVDGTFLPIAP